MWHIEVFRVSWERTIWSRPTFREALDFMALYPQEEKAGTIRAVFVCGGES
jgi:hypothetical protein